MRQSKRDHILEAAKRIVQREGVTALTYESVAVEAGLTKGGLIYHFPSREDLLRGLHEHVAGQWEEHLHQEAGTSATKNHDDGEAAGVRGLEDRRLEDLSAEERLAAYVRASQNPDRAELLLMLEAAEDPQAQAAWDSVESRWGVPQPGADASEDQLRAFIAQLAADGLWFWEANSPRTLDPVARQRLVERIIELGRAGSAD